MLQTEDIDDDYFTPASSTSLANIFGKSRNEDATDNNSLKYTPPKPSQLTLKPEEQKVTQCIFACALVGYEWSNKAYTTRGKLGFAILNILKTGIHNIILYDSKKVTLSNATISTTFEVTVKEKRYFSYLDNLQKYWSLYVSEEELNKILGLLKNFNVTIKYSSESKTGPDEIKSLEQTGVISEQDVNDEKESDTDSSLNRKTKISLLSRMAHMGQSVLPPRVTPIDKSSDSSDASDNNHSKASRHKPIKTVVKRNSSEKGVTECHSLVEAQNLMPKKEHSTESMPLFTYINGQLVPVTNTNIITSSGVSSGNDMNYIISEQRMNNSELRININRISDKLDKILSNVPNVESGDKNSNTNKFQVEILQKLISEYENKIRVYEEFIRFNKSEDGSINVTKLLPNSELQPSEQLKETCLIKDKIHKLEQSCLEKDTTINILSSDIKLMQIKYNETIEKLNKEIQNLNHELEMRKEEYSNLLSKYENQSSKNEDESDMGGKIKNIMNDTFRAISANFENGESYSGERVKTVAATVIKRITIESLNSI